MYKKNNTNNQLCFYKKKLLIKQLLLKRKRKQKHGYVPVNSGMILIKNITNRLVDSNTF